MGLSSFFKKLFGSTKETASELADKAETTFEQAKETAAPYLEKAETLVADTFEKAKELLDSEIQRIGAVVLK